MLTAQQIESGVIGSGMKTGKPLFLFIHFNIHLLARKKVVSYHPIDARKKSVPCKTGKEAKDYYDLSAQKMSPDNTLRDVSFCIK